MTDLATLRAHLEKAMWFLKTDSGIDPSLEIAAALKIVQRLTDERDNDDSSTAD